MISNFLDNPLDSPFAFVNTVYFNGKWSHAFEKSNSKNKTFYNFDNSESNVTFMNSTHEYYYSEDDKFTMVGLPMGNGDFIMSFVISKDESKSTKFDYSEWELLKANASLSEVEVTVPRFDVYYRTDILTDLKSAHPGDLKEIKFDAFANLEYANINTILHGATISINEDGCKAASASVAGGYTSNMANKRVEFNRPFNFVIYEKNSDVVLYMGAINKL